MSETFKYPNATTPTITLTFADGHRISDGEIITYNQIADHTVGGVLMVKALGDEFRRWQYTVVIPLSSTSTDLADIISFFSSTYATGAAKTFVWTDYLSEARTVRMTGGLSISAISGTYVEVAMNIELENT